MPGAIVDDRIAAFQRSWGALFAGLSAPLRGLPGAAVFDADDLVVPMLGRQRLAETDVYIVAVAQVRPHAELAVDDRGAPDRLHAVIGGQPRLREEAGAEDRLE